jgi:hypothetical protein
MLVGLKLAMPRNHRVLAPKDETKQVASPIPFSQARLAKVVMPFTEP